MAFTFSLHSEESTQAESFKTVFLFQVWIVDNSGGVKHETPLGSVSTLWPGMPRAPDAGFTWTNGLTYFFVGKTTINGYTRYVIINHQSRQQNVLDQFHLLVAKTNENEQKD